MKIETMSGLEILLNIINGDLPHPPIAKTIPMQFCHAEPGKIIFKAMATDNHMNPMGGTHGGFASTVLDSVTGCAIHSMLEPGDTFGTIELGIKMVRPVPRDIWLIANGKLINISRSLGVSSGVIKDEQGKLYAHGTTTCMIKRCS